MSNVEIPPLSKDQIMDLLLISGQQAALIRAKLIDFLTLHGIPNLAARTTGELVGEVILLEKTIGPLGTVMQSVVAPSSIHLEPEHHSAARRIMGDNFMGIPEVTKSFGFIDLKTQASLSVIPFDEATLRDCRHTHMLVADTGLSIKGVRQRIKYALTWDHPEVEELAKLNESPAWRLIQTREVTHSGCKEWNKQCRLLGQDEYVPTARQLVHAIMQTLAKPTLTAAIIIRTNDVTSTKKRVTLRFTHFRELRIEQGDDSSLDSNLRIMCAKKPPIEVPQESSTNSSAG
ncbi:MAG: hypothetical protein WAZ14_03855 [Patescibacteria group bacterium]